MWISATQHGQLFFIGVVCFWNVVVCKFFLHEFDSLPEGERFWSSVFDRWHLERLLIVGNEVDVWGWLLARSHHDSHHVESLNILLFPTLGKAFADWVLYNWYKIDENLFVELSWRVYALQLVGKQLSSGLEFGLSYQFTFRPQLKVVSENVEQDDTASTVQQSTNVPQRTKQLCRLFWFMLFLLLCLLGFFVFGWFRFLRFLWSLLFGLCIFP